MKDNKVLSAIYGIALFVALIGAVGLFYNAIEMLNYTTFRNSWSELLKQYTDFQKPIGTALLVASVFCILGAGAGVCYLFVKKPLLKNICLLCISLAVLVIVAVMISVSNIWKGHYKDMRVDYNYGYLINKPYYVGGRHDEKLPQAFAIYSASLTSLIQNLVCYVVIAALLVYDFVKGVKGRKKEAAV